MPRTKSAETKAKDAARQREKFRIISYQAPAAEHAAFRAWCEAHGTTMHATLRAYVRSLIENDAPREATPSHAEQNNTREGN